MNQIPKDVKKNMEVYIRFQKMAAHALAQYEDKQKYPTNDKQMCIDIMDRQIAELKAINAEWIKLADSAYGKKRYMHRFQFYEDFVVKAEEHRATLAAELLAENTEQARLYTSLWERIKQHFKNLFKSNDTEEEES